MAVRRASSSRRPLPDFLIVGAAKSGTTSFYNYLVQHPCIRPAFKKEVHYFDRNFDKGAAWYRSFFPLRRPPDADCGRWLTGESSPYYLFHPLAAARIREVIPRARFFIVLRNPIDRAVSHYNHRVRAGQETLPIEEAFEAETRRLQGEEERLAAGQDSFSFNHYYYSYLARGRYAGQLERWFRLLPREQCLVIDSQALLSDPETVYREALQHLGLAPAGPVRFDLFNRGTQDAYRDVSPAFRKQLAAGFREDNQALFRLLGRTFDWDP